MSSPGAQMPPRRSAIYWMRVCVCVCCSWFHLSACWTTQWTLWPLSLFERPPTKSSVLCLWSGWVTGPARPTFYPSVWLHNCVLIHDICRSAWFLKVLLAHTHWYGPSRRLQSVLWLTTNHLIMSHLQWTPEGRRLVTGASSGEFTLWNGLTFNFETILQVNIRTLLVSSIIHTDVWLIPVYLYIFHFPDTYFSRCTANTLTTRSFLCVWSSGLLDGSLMLMSLFPLYGSTTTWLVLFTTWLWWHSKRAEQLLKCVCWESTAIFKYQQ